LPDPEQTVLRHLGLSPFRARFPWWGADLQTLRDTLRAEPLPPDRGRPLPIDLGAGDRLLTFFDPPFTAHPRGLVVLLHGLGGSSAGVGVRRLGLALQAAGFAVLRLNMRGAGAGRSLARGTYAAQCNRDLLPALQWARELAQQQGLLMGRPAAQPLPLLGVGISLGGTMLLNACLERPALDAVVCISSLLDLSACAAQMEHPRNWIYAQWMLRGLSRQTLADGKGLREQERAALIDAGRPTSIREFDALITAPRWGYASVADYYRAASPLPGLLAAAQMPPYLLIQALDDPWVPAESAMALKELDTSPSAGVHVQLTCGGGHGGFHGIDDDLAVSWSDRLTAAWLRWICAEL
jgi:predicted alpha/beta-fold hydrolase